MATASEHHGSAAASQPRRKDAGLSGNGGQYSTFGLTKSTTTLPSATIAAGEEPWPAVTRETRPWHTNPNQPGPNGTRPNRQDRMLTEIEVQIPAEISGLSPALTPQTQALADEAARAVTALEARAAHLAGLGDLLARTESVASSKIEHVYADLDDIARASIGAEAGESARKTYAAATAMRALMSSVDAKGEIDLEAVLEAHQALMAGDRLEGAWAGRLREQQNWIGGSDFSPRDAVHIPPPHTEVRRLMDDLMSYSNQDTSLPIAQAAIAHAQFESIHPFTDGNGRVGRALIGAVLRRRGVTSTVSVPIAAAMLTDVDTYFEALGSYREGDVVPIVEHISDSAVRAAEAAETSADRLAVLPQQWRETVRARRGSATSTLLDSLLTHPVLDIAATEQATGASRPRAYDALTALEDAGILREITGGARNRVWVVGDVIDEMSELEERIGRRSKPSARWR